MKVYQSFGMRLLIIGLMSLILSPPLTAQTLKPATESTYVKSVELPLKRGVHAEKR